MIKVDGDLINLMQNIFVQSSPTIKYKFDIMAIKYIGAFNDAVNLLEQFMFVDTALATASNVIPRKFRTDQINTFLFNPCQKQTKVKTMTDDSNFDGMDFPN